MDVACCKIYNNQDTHKAVRYNASLPFWTYVIQSTSSQVHKRMVTCFTFIQQVNFVSGRYSIVDGKQQENIINLAYRLLRQSYAAFSKWFRLKTAGPITFFRTLRIKCTLAASAAALSVHSSQPPKDGTRSIVLSVTHIEARLGI